MRVSNFFLLILLVVNLVFSSNIDLESLWNYYNDIYSKEKVLDIFNNLAKNNERVKKFLLEKQAYYLDKSLDYNQLFILFQKNYVLGNYKLFEDIWNKVKSKKIDNYYDFLYLWLDYLLKINDKERLEKWINYIKPIDRKKWALKLIKKGYKDLAKKLVNTITSKDEMYYLVLGKLLWQSGKKQQALTIFKEGFAKYPESGNLFLNLTMALYDLKKYEELNGLLKTYSFFGKFKNEREYINILLLLKDGKIEEARKKFDALKVRSLPSYLSSALGTIKKFFVNNK